MDGWRREGVEPKAGDGGSDGVWRLTEGKYIRKKEGQVPLKRGIPCIPFLDINLTYPFKIVHLEFVALSLYLGRFGRWPLCRNDGRKPSPMPTIVHKDEVFC